MPILTLGSQPEVVFLKIHILCDLHVEFGNFVPPVVGADVVVLAGDVHCEIGKTRVVCNPRGYAPIEINKGFRPDYTLVV